MNINKKNLNKDDHNCDQCSHACPDSYVYKTEKGISPDTVKKISQAKNEPSWMLEYRLASFDFFTNKKMQKWGPDLSDLNLDDICFYLKPVEKQQDSWQNLPKDIKNTFDDLGVTKSEQEYFGGLGAQYESEVVYHNLKKELQDQGVIFVDTDSALKLYPEIFKKYFGTVVPFNDNKFSALNGAVWSGGSFIYVPKNVKVELPLQAYYRINSKQLGQFERTLIIADAGSSVSYIEGCTAPKHSENSLHSAVVEIIALEGAKVKYYTVQNWAGNVYNLVTKRALAKKDAIVEWIDCNVGSRITMKYPAVILEESGAKAEVLSLSVAGFDGQIQDSGAKMIHLAANTSSKIVSKSLSYAGGRSSFRSKVKVIKGAKNCKSFVKCDGLVIDKKSRSDAYPNLEIFEKNVEVGHEARVSPLADEQIFYLMSRGLDLHKTESLIINGFIEPFTRGLPPEYAVEINRLVDMQIKGSF